MLLINTEKIIETEIAGIEKMLVPAYKWKKGIANKTTQSVDVSLIENKRLSVMSGIATVVSFFATMQLPISSR